jgi:penicillin amidase
VEAPEAAGSNQWAVAGARTAGGGALLAGDMHLGLEVPNIWYRARLVYPDPESPGNARRQVTGVTLPGAPAVVAGSNGDVAWTFTNAQVDVSDLVVLESAGATGDAYETAAGPRVCERRSEVIGVRGGASDTLWVLETIWGPVIDTDHAGRRRVLRWIAHEPTAVNLGLLDLEAARDVDAALDIANRTGIPTQNCIVAGRDGRIGWTLMGPLPRRFGCDGRLPGSWAAGERGWDGMRAPSEYPRLVDPGPGFLWTANNRVAGGDVLATLGDGGYALGARARQIRDGLTALEAATPLDMLRLQLDDRAVFLAPWRDLLLGVLARDGAEPQWSELAAHVRDWGGRASVASVGYRIVREFRRAVSAEVFAALLRPCRAADPRVHEGLLRQREGPLWRLVQERPPHLLAPRFPSWEALLAAAVDTTLVRLRRAGPDLAARTWGEANTTRIRHPLSRAVPQLGCWLDMRRRPLPGDVDVPRVQGPAFGASQRLVVSPGREESGYFHMPCGQSGHPMSRFYRNSHVAWEEGRATPFLPGPVAHTLVLEPHGAARGASPEQRVGQAPKIRHDEIGARRSRWRGAETGGMAALHPDRGDPERARRNDVVVEALRRVQDTR